MKLYFAALVAVSHACSWSDHSCAQLLVLTTDELPRPLGLDSAAPPRFSWRADARGASALPRAASQTAFRLQVAASATALLTGPYVWNVRIVTTQSSFVEYGGSALSPGTAYHWRVAPEWNHNVTRTFWSRTALFSVAPVSYMASFIGLPPSSPSFNQSNCPWLRSEEFELLQPLEADDIALVYVGSVGFHELWVNGQKANSDVLSPQVTDLGKRIPVRAYDVSVLLKTGKNVLGLWLSVGWAAFDSVNPRVHILFNTTAAPIAFAELTVQRGLAAPNSLVVSNGNWRVSHSDTAHRGLWTNSNFGGDYVDARLSQPDWASIDGVAHAHWLAATVYPVPSGRRLSTEVLEPNRVREHIPVRSVISLGNQSFMVEFDRLFTGFITALDLVGEPFSMVTLKASSVPMCGDVFHTRAIAQGRPFCQNFPEYNMQHEYILDSNGTGNFTARFSYHEMQYVEIAGVSRIPKIVGKRVGNIAVLSNNDGDAGGGRIRLAWFDSSSPSLNLIYNTSLWTKANLVTGGISVDCPHRERLGYIGDAHTTLETSLQNFASLNFFEKWAQDIVDVQGYPAHSGEMCDGLQDCGYIPHTAPTIDGGGGPGWSGFICVMPWQVYLAYGDTRILRLSYPAQARLLRFWNRSQTKKIDGGDGLIHNWATGDMWSFLGDWLTPHGSESSDSKEALLFNNCYILFCTRIVANISFILGEDVAGAAYEAMATDLAHAIHSTFFIPATSGYIDTLQTHLVMPLIANVPPLELREKVMNLLKSEIVLNQRNHIDTGLHGTYFMTKLFTDTSYGFGGEDDLVANYTLTSTHPGYIDILSKGYTTWPEWWGSCADPDKRNTHMFLCKNWTSGSLSSMHGTLNGIGQWFIAGLGGIRRMKGRVGYQHFELRPAFNIRTLSWVTASFLSSYGEIVSSYIVDTVSSTIEYNVTVPPNSKATLYIPAIGVDVVKEGGVLASKSIGVTLLSFSDSLALFEVGSGSYTFTTRLAKPGEIAYI